MKEKTRRQIENWLRENMLSMVSIAAESGWGNKVYHEDLEEHFPNRLKKILSVNVPRLRDGNFADDFQVLYDREVINIPTTAEELAICKAHRIGYDVRHFANLIKAGDSFAIGFYEDEYRYIRREIYSKN